MRIVRVHKFLDAVTLVSLAFGTRGSNTLADLVLSAAPHNDHNDRDSHDSLTFSLYSDSAASLPLSDSNADTCRRVPPPPGDLSPRPELTLKELEQCHNVDRSLHCTGGPPTPRLEWTPEELKHWRMQRIMEQPPKIFMVEFAWGQTIFVKLMDLEGAVCQKGYMNSDTDWSTFKFGSLNSIPFDSNRMNGEVRFLVHELESHLRQLSPASQPYSEYFAFDDFLTHDLSYHERGEFGYAAVVIGLSSVEPGDDGRSGRCTAQVAFCASKVGLQRLMAMRNANWSESKSSSAVRKSSSATTVAGARAVTESQPGLRIRFRKKHKVESAPVVSSGSGTDSGTLAGESTMAAFDLILSGLSRLSLACLSRCRFRKTTGSRRLCCIRRSYCSSTMRTLPADGSDIVMGTDAASNGISKNLSREDKCAMYMLAFMTGRSTKLGNLQSSNFLRSRTVWSSNLLHRPCCCKVRAHKADQVQQQSSTTSKIAAPGRKLSPGAIDTFDELKSRASYGSGERPIYSDDDPEATPQYLDMLWSEHIKFLAFVRLFNMVTFTHTRIISDEAESETFDGTESCFNFKFQLEGYIGFLKTAVMKCQCYKNQKGLPIDPDSETTFSSSRLAALLNIGVSKASSLPSFGVSVDAWLGASNCVWTLESGGERGHPRYGKGNIYFCTHPYFRILLHATEEPVVAVFDFVDHSGSSHYRHSETTTESTDANTDRFRVYYIVFSISNGALSMKFGMNFDCAKIPQSLNDERAAATQTESENDEGTPAQTDSEGWPFYKTSCQQ